MAAPQLVAQLGAAAAAEREAVYAELFHLEEEHYGTTGCPRRQRRAGGGKLNAFIGAVLCETD
jgi:hypothetical protein